MPALAPAIRLLTNLNTNPQARPQVYLREVLSRLLNKIAARITVLYRAEESDARNDAVFRNVLSSVPCFHTIACDRIAFASAFALAFATRFASVRPRIRRIETNGDSCR